MIRLFTFFLIVNLFFSCSENSVQTQKPAQVINLESEALLAKLETNKGVILDVRTKEEVANGYLIDASFIDFYDSKFDTKASWIKKDQPIYVYCHAGGRSVKAAEKLIELGFNEVYNLSGGYSNWKSSGYPIKQGLEINIKDYKLYNSKQIDEILNSNDHTLLVFKTPWCLPCKQLDPVLAEFSKLNDDWKVLIINMDANPKLAESYNVSSVPSLIAFNGNTNYFRNVGFLDLNALNNAVLKN